MATGTLSPDPRLQFEDANGNPYAAGKLYTYLAGTSTLAATYSDVGLTIANANPIILNSAGRPSTAGVEIGIFLSPGTSYKYILQDSTGASVWTADNISAVPASSANLDIIGTAGEALSAGQPAYLSDGSGGKTAGQWYKGDSANTYSSTLPEVGMIPAAIAIAATGTIRLGGSVTGLTSLSLGASYYIGTSGTITSTAPANARFLGVADTTSSLVLKDVQPLADNGINDFRLTLESGVPVSNTDQTAKTTLYATPSGKGNRIALYTTAGVSTVYPSAEFSIAVPATTSTMYDVFAYNNSGVPALELLAWTNDTTRATAIVLTTTGTYTKSGDLTRRYLGSFRTTGSSGQTEDSASKRYVWNYGNRARRTLLRRDSSSSYTYTTATWRQAHADTANQVEAVIGVADVPVSLTSMSLFTTATASLPVAIGIGVDSTTVPTTSAIGGSGDSGTGNVFTPLIVKADFYPSVGRHYFAMLEFSTASGTTTWYGGGSLVATIIETGITGFIEG